MLHVVCVYGHSCTSVRRVVTNNCTLCWDESARKNAALTQLRSLTMLLENDGGHAGGGRPALFGNTITPEMCSMLVGQVVAVTLFLLGLVL